MESRGKEEERGKTEEKACIKKGETKIKDFNNREKWVHLNDYECEKGENNQTYVKGYKNGQSMNNDVRYFEMGQKEERERIFEMIDKMDWYPWPERLVKLKKEIMQDDRT